LVKSAKGVAAENAPVIDGSCELIVVFRSARGFREFGKPA